MKCAKCPNKADDGYTIRDRGNRVVAVCEGCWGEFIRAYYPRRPHTDLRGEYQPKGGTR